MGGDECVASAHVGRCDWESDATYHRYTGLEGHSPCVPRCVPDTSGPTVVLCESINEYIVVRVSWTTAGGGQLQFSWPVPCDFLSADADWERDAQHRSLD